MLRRASRLISDRTATSAVEFAFVAPVLLLMTFGIIGYGYVLGIYHGIQQIASEAARASVSGLNDAERARIARDFVVAHASSYAFIDPAKIRVTTSQSPAPQQVFEVAVVYGLGLGVPGLGPAVSGVIAGAATPLDQVLNAVLGTLGLGLGQADSWVTGVRCGGAVLVR